LYSCLDRDVVFRGYASSAEVWASSETVLGLPFDERPPYAPVDEDDPPRPNSTYSPVKTLEEELARQLCGWYPDLSMIGLRFSNVTYPEDYAQFPSYDADPQLRRWNLWSYIDALDGARAVQLALDADLPGADVFIIANADTVMSRPTDALLAEVFPNVPHTRPVERDAARDRQGTTHPRLRTTALLAQRGGPKLMRRHNHMAVGVREPRQR
jgi:nucleoside-diphosphate-sugar epimerase